MTTHQDLNPPSWATLTAPADIPRGCICSYTWAVHRPGIVRNGPVASCPADHSEVDK